MPTIDVNGLRIAYHRAGAGPPLVLIHGFVGDGATTWRWQLHGLRDEFTVVAWDAPGAGDSADPPPGFGLADYADCLAGLVQNLGLNRPHVAGLSFGGTLALELYRRHPRLPATLVLASAYAGWGGSLPADVVQKRVEQALALASLPPEDLVAALLPTMFSPNAPPEAVEAFGDSMRRFHPAGFLAMAHSAADSLRDVLPDIAVPTLLLCGDKDVRAPRSVAEDLHAAIAGSTLVVLPDVGHVCNLEAPAEFNRAVRAFLRDHP
jgi:pimeloyl-ACP methyl ester carboxylesterase